MEFFTTSPDGYISVRFDRGSAAVRRVKNGQAVELARYAAPVGEYGVNFSGPEISIDRDHQSLPAIAIPLGRDFDIFLRVGERIATLGTVVPWRMSVFLARLPGSPARKFAAASPVRCVLVILAFAVIFAGGLFFAPVFLITVVTPIRFFRFVAVLFLLALPFTPLCLMAIQNFGSPVGEQVTLAARNAKKPAPPPNTPAITLVVIGGSAAAGNPVPREKAFPHYLELTARQQGYSVRV
jgi:hypothetical protein